AAVDAAWPRGHMVDPVCHEVARQVDWEGLARAFARRALREAGWELPAEGEELSLARIAEQNGRLVDLIRNEVSGLIEHRIWADHRLSHEFRIAMIRLCQGLVDPGLSPVPPEAIRRWVRGELLRISEVKPAPLFQKVARHNARHLLTSLPYWLHLCGCGGLFLVLDIERCLLVRSGRRDPQDASRYYTAATCRDAYEALRELVDATDDLEHAFVTVLAPPEFLDPDHRRSVWRYNALKLRIWDEVRDEQRANPLGALVRLSRREPSPEEVVA
ncbi:MAG: BREX system ATP-binding domain-containing protein, partial [Candidatus Latescibacterota bacterium]